MMKFKISPDRLAEVASIVEYVGATAGNAGAILLLLPKLLVDDAGEYVVKVTLDDDGDIAEMTGLEEASRRIQSAITAKRMESLKREVQAALKNIVNPPSGRG